jgi:hypothetical protein
LLKHPLHEVSPPIAECIRKQQFFLNFKHKLDVLRQELGLPVRGPTLLNECALLRMCSFLIFASPLLCFWGGK